MAVTLAAVGVFGLISYSTARATHDFGIRMALVLKAACAVAGFEKRTGPGRGLDWVLGLAPPFGSRVSWLAYFLE